MEPVKVDPQAECVTFDPDGYLRVDGVVVLQLVIRGDSPYLRFLDRDRMRSVCRKPPSRWIEVAMVPFLDRIRGEGQKRATEA